MSGFVRGMLSGAARVEDDGRLFTLFFRPSNVILPAVFLACEKARVLLCCVRGDSVLCDRCRSKELEDWLMDTMIWQDTTRNALSSHPDLYVS